MFRIPRPVLSGMVVLSSLLFVGCAKLDKSSVQANNETPEGSYVPEISIPYDPKLPHFVVAVEPFNMDTNSVEAETVDQGRERCKGSSCSSKTSVKTVGHGVSAQLMTALTNAGNISVVDMGVVKKVNGLYSAKLRKGEKGLYVIKGTVTEFTENAEASEDSNSASLGMVGAVTGIAGAISGNRALMWTGAGVAAANPSYEATESEKKGMVALDLQLLDGSSGRLVKAFKVNGTFTAKSAVNGFSLFGIGNQKKQFAQSVLGQAMRVAMNDAVVKVNDALKTRR